MDQQTNNEAGFRTYEQSEGFNGDIGMTVASSTPAWRRPPTPPAGAPDVITIVLDDLGYAQLGCFGGLGGRISTPHIDALAQQGLRFRNFHATPLCSPTRAALLTGRNAHSVGVGMIMEYATGYPGYDSVIPADAAMTPAVLRGAGYATMALGKWHLTPEAENGPWGPFDRWPLAKGFDRYYGFMPGETSQWEPELWEDNHRVEAPGRPEDGYHLTADLVDRATAWIDEEKAVTPSRPYYLYLALGAMHAPHHAPREWIERYAGAFDDGWDVVRAETLAKQKELGVVPEDTELAPHNEGVRSWSEIGDDERRVLCRQMEAFAGFLSHTDDQIGRLLDFLRQSGRLDNTMIVLLSDNGASAEGGRSGLFHELSYFNRSPEDVQQMVDRLDEWGGPTSHPHYATGWAEAGNTPNRWYKTTCHEGGTRVPFIVHWPAGIDDPGAVRSQYAHVIDVAPTLLEAIGTQAPAEVAGVRQRPVDGVSMADILRTPTAPTGRSVQHFECFGHRSVWRDGWKASAIHNSSTHAFRTGRPPELTHDGDFDADEWELYHLDEDFAELRDLSAEQPELLRELVDLWWAEAETHGVLPLDDRGSPRLLDPRPRALEQRSKVVYSAPVMLGASSSPQLVGRSFEVSVDFEAQHGDTGALVSYGNWSGGFSLYLIDDRLHATMAYLGREEFPVSATEPLTPGRHRAVLRFTRNDEPGGASPSALAQPPVVGTLGLELDGAPVGERPGVRSNPILWPVGQGLQVGGDSISSVSSDYQAPFPFGGQIHRVEVDVVSRQATPTRPDTAMVQQ